MSPSNLQLAASQAVARITEARAALSRAREAGNDDALLLWTACDLASASGTADSLIIEALGQSVRSAPAEKPEARLAALSQIAKGQVPSWPNQTTLEGENIHS